MDTQAVVRTGLSEAEEKDEILKLLKEIKLVSSQVTINANYSRSSLSQSSSWDLDLENINAFFNVNINVTL